MRVKALLTVIFLAAMVVFNAGCALLNTALAAGLSYAIYQASQ